MLALLVQTNTGTSSLASTIVAFSSNTTAGNSIIVTVGNTGTLGNVSGVTDTQGNVYVKDSQVSNGLLGELEVWRASGIKGGANTVTVAYTTGASCAVITREYYGFISANTLDKQVSNTGSSNTLSSGSTTSLTQNSELLIGVGLIVLGDVFSAGGNFVNLTSLNAPATIMIAAEDLLVTSGGVQSATFGVNTTTQWACVILTYYLSPTGTTTSTSSTSASTFSTSSTSSSISTTSSSISSTSKSTSTSSTSNSTSSTSSSVSSTSSSISSTSGSTTSQSTSISSTSSSISSTSFSSTSQSTTSQSTSVSSTSSSISSTSSSISSTSASFSSTSFSSTSSSSSVSTTTIPPNLKYTYQDSLSLPLVSSDDLDNDTPKNVQNLSVDDGDYFIQYGSEYMIQEYKYRNKNNTDAVTFSWKGRTTQSTVTSPFLVQVWNSTLAVPGGGKLIGSYSETNKNSDFTLILTSTDFVGQSFVGTGEVINAVKFYVKKQGAVNGIYAAQIYATTGTNGVNAVYTGVALAQSDNITGSTSFTDQYQLITSNFTGANRFTPTLGITYTVVFASLTSTTDRVLVGYGSAPPSNPGNRNWDDTGTPTFDAASDVCYYLYTIGGWETLAVVNTQPADTDFKVVVNQTANLSNYYDANNTVTFRTYQQVV